MRHYAGNGSAMALPTMRIAVLAMLAWMMLAAAPAAGAVSATVDRNAVRMGESVRLIITFDGNADLRAFDAAPLEEDFNVLGTSTRSEVSIVDGERRVTTRLLVDLLPRREGAVRVPAMVFADGVTEAIRLEVLPAGVGAVGADVFLEVEVEPKTVYVQAPVNVAVRLFYRKSILEGNLSDPELDNAWVRRFGEDTQYAANRDGVSYRVIERRFVVFPRQSGELRIPRIEFVGRVAGDHRGAAFGRLFQAGRQLSARSDETTVDVLPPPAAAADEWFPARRVTLTESWPDEPPRFVVGESVTRTLRVEAMGVTGEQIPRLKVAEADGVRHYPDKPAIETGARDDTLFGTREQRIALVPSRPGTVTLPAVAVHWWDTVADRARVARIPARTIQVGAAPGSVAAPPPAEPLAADAGDADSAGVAGAQALPAAPTADGFPWLAVGFAALWLATCLLWWYERRRRLPRGSPPNGPRRSPPAASLKKACRDGEPGAARAALLAWARTRWPDDPPPGLQALAARLDDADLKPAFARLDAACYAPGAASFDGAAFIRRVAPALEGRAIRGSDESVSPLPPLYPGNSVS